MTMSRLVASAMAVIAACLSLSFAGPALGEPQNLVPNPGFENETPLQWTMWDREGAGNTGARDTTTSHSGRACARLDSTHRGWVFFSTGGEEIFGPPHIALEPNTPYYLGAWVKVKNGVSLRFRIYLRELDAQGREITPTPGYVSSAIEQPGEGQWKECGSVIRTQPGTAKGLVWIEISEGLGTVYYDDVILAKGNTPPGSVNGAQGVDGEGRSYAKLVPAALVEKVQKAPAIDGKEEDLWSALPARSDFYLDSDCSSTEAVENLAPARCATEFKLLRDDHNLYFLATCKTPPDAYELKSRTAARDIFASDSIALRFRSVDSDKSAASVYRITSAGKLTDAAGRPVKGAKAAVIRADDSWNVEVAVPIDAIGVRDGWVRAEVIRTSAFERSVWPCPPSGRALGILAFERSRNPVESISVPVAIEGVPYTPSISLSDKSHATHIDIARLSPGLPDSHGRLRPGIYEARLVAKDEGKISNVFAWTFEVLPRIELRPTNTFLSPWEEMCTVTIRDLAPPPELGWYSITLSGPDGKVLWRKSLDYSPEVSGVHVLVPWEAQQYTLKVAIVDGYAKGIAAYATEVIQRIASPPLNPPIKQVTCVAGNILVNGEPFIPVLGYYVVYDTPPARADGISGMETVTNTKEEMLAHLDLAETSNIYAYCTMFHPYFTRGAMGSDFIPERLEEGIPLVRDKPYLLFWEPYDEPDGHQVPPAVFTKLREDIHRLDPNHPVYMTLCVPEKYKDYAPTADVIGIDPYSASVPVVAQCITMAREAAGPDKPVQLIVCTYVPDMNTQNRLPSPSLVRCQVYAGLILGVRGIGYYDYHPHGTGLGMTNEPTGRLKRAARGLNHEIRELTPVLCKGIKSTAVKVTSEYGSVLWTALEYDGCVTLLLANPLPSPVQFSLRSDKLKGASGNALFAPGKITFDKGGLGRFSGVTGTPGVLGPLEVRVLQIPILR